MARGDLQYDDRDVGCHWFDHAAWIARSRVRRPRLYTDHAEDYVDVLCWAFEYRYRDFESWGFFDDGDEDTQETTEQTTLVTDGGVDVDVPDRGAGTCPRCGADLDFFYPTHGYRYWTCPGRHPRPVIVMGPEIVRWAAPLTRDRVRAGRFGEEERFDTFDADAPDPGRFVDRLCDRIQLLTESTREDELERRADEADQESAGDDAQSSLAGGWLA